MVSQADAGVSEAVLSRRNAVVIVLVNDKDGSPVATGSGFILNSRGVVATSCNIIGKWVERPEYTLVVKTEDGATFPIMDLLSGNCRNHLALFKLRGDDFPAAKLASGFAPRSGDGVFIIDRSSGKEITVSGVVSYPGGKDGIFQVSVPLTPEREGSAVFNTKGEIIGIWTFPPGKGQGRHMVVPVKYMDKEFNKYKGFIKETFTPRPAPVPLPLPPVSSPEILGPPPAQRTAEEEFRRGAEYEGAKMYREAIEAYESAIRMKPGYGEAHASVGLVYYRLGRYSEAIEAYRQALKFKPGAQYVYNRLGTAYIITGEYSKALSSFKQSLSLDPGSAETHFNLGVACIIAGDRDGAVEQYVILKEIDRARAEKLLDLIR